MHSDVFEGNWKRLLLAASLAGLSGSWALAADLSQVLGLRVDPVVKQLTVQLSTPNHATLISPVEKGQRRLVIDIPGASLSTLPDKASLLRTLRSQLPEVADITLDEFRSNTPMVRLVVKTKTLNTSGALLKDTGNMLVLQLLKQETPVAAAAPISQAVSAKVQPLKPTEDKLPKAVLTGTTVKMAPADSSRLLQRKIEEANALREERNRLADQVQNLRRLADQQNAMIAHIKTEQEVLQIKHADTPEKARIQVLQHELEELNKSDATLRDTLKNAETQISALESALKQAQEKQIATEARFGENPLPPASAQARGALLNTLDQLSPAQLNNLVDAEKAYRDGKNAEMTGKLDAAQIQYKRALQLSPQVADYALSLGMLYLNQKRVDDAQNVLLAALQYHPDDTDLLNELGKTALLQKDSAKALHYFAKALPSGVLSNYASTLKRSQKLADAEAVYKLAVAITPDDSDLQFNLGNLYLNQKRFPEAQQRFQEAIRLNTGFAEAHYHLGLAYVEQGKIAEAKRELKTYLDKMPNASNKAAVQSYLVDLEKAYPTGRSPL